jgi:peptidoglycan hydrolase-like protein with peptidoglycan-binding domain
MRPRAPDGAVAPQNALMWRAPAGAPPARSANVLRDGAAERPGPGGAEQCFENDGIIDAMLMSFLRGLAALTLTFGLMMMVAAAPAQAQDPTERVWIQIESYASLGNTEARIRAYTPQFDNVNGFNAGGGFYAITLGPYQRAEAQRLLGELVAAGRIPSDSFIQPRQAFAGQFFPIGEDRLDGAIAGAPGVTTDATGAESEAAAAAAEAAAAEAAAAAAIAEAEAAARAAEAAAAEAAAAQAEAEAAAAAAAAEAEAAAAAQAAADAEAAARAEAEAAAAAEAEAAARAEAEAAAAAAAEAEAAARAEAEAAAAAEAEAAAQAEAEAAAQAEAAALAAAEAEAAAAEAAAQVVVIQEETPAEARQSEAQLTRQERDALQVALQYFGFYRGGIDGAFGPGTRGAMTDWQIARGLEPTGVLTTRQRAQLLEEYETELARLGYAQVTDAAAGIDVVLPMGMVAFSDYNFPFARYLPINDSGLTILLISQPGDRATLFGLYEIMQTLEIVPLEGERERGSDSFVLTGQSDTLRSHTEARVTAGAVKGFSLIWEPERDEDVAQILPRIRETIDYFPGTLDPAFVPEDAAEDIDLVSGFEVRQPELLRSGFFVDAAGTVVTTTQAVTGESGRCDRILIDNAYPASIAYQDAELGLAVVRPDQALAPLAFARIAPTPGRIRGEVAVAGFPFGGALSYASTTFGSISALEGVDGETWMQRLDLRTGESEAGGPVLDASGAVLGMVLPGTAGQRMLPDEVTLALRSDSLIEAMAGAGVPLQTANGIGPNLNRDQLARLGADIAVRVSCWN